jgi:hypothetical protein
MLYSEMWAPGESGRNLTKFRRKYFSPIFKVEETLVPGYDAIQRHIPVNKDPQIHSSENLTLSQEIHISTYHVGPGVQ